MAEEITGKRRRSRGEAVRPQSIGPKGGCRLSKTADAALSLTEAMAGVALALVEMEVIAVGGVAPRP